MRGILMAGGSGSRLRPTTLAVNKHLLPVYDKPLIYYPLATLMLAGVREILIVVPCGDVEPFERLLGDGSQFGVEITFVEQDSPRGIADAFRLGANFIADGAVALMLGDNVFHGAGLGRALQATAGDIQVAHVFACTVSDPRPYAVVTFDDEGYAVHLEEKPTHPRSNFAVPGLYFYPPEVVSIAQRVEPGPRGELEITTVNQALLEEGSLVVHVLPRGTMWMDAGTPDSLQPASVFVAALSSRQGLVVGSPEEVAMRLGWITPGALRDRAAKLGDTGYARYLAQLADHD